jgi:hypothetical protein
VWHPPALLLPSWCSCSLRQRCSSPQEPATLLRVCDSCSSLACTLLRMLLTLDKYLEPSVTCTHRLAYDKHWLIVVCARLQCCGTAECLTSLNSSCLQLLPCGHHCCGRRGHGACMPCLVESCMSAEAPRVSRLHQQGRGPQHARSTSTAMGLMLCLKLRFDICVCICRHSHSVLHWPQGVACRQLRPTSVPTTRMLLVIWF